MTTLDAIRDDACGESYPRHLLKMGGDALVLFAAGFLGRQDGYWIALAGMTATCVDVRPHLLDQMAELYPTDWEFVEADAYDYAEKARRQWDVLSIDCPSTHFERCAEELPLWCSRARSSVVLGTSAGTRLQVPAGWQLVERRFRSDNYGGTEWAVLERV